eukprot:1185123-Prorocentrum_minimum.AAC.2
MQPGPPGREGEQKQRGEQPPTREERGAHRRGAGHPRPLEGHEGVRHAVVVQHFGVQLRREAEHATPVELRGGERP